MHAEAIVDGFSVWPWLVSSPISFVGLTMRPHSENTIIGNLQFVNVDEYIVAVCIRRTEHEAVSHQMLDGIFDHSLDNLVVFKTNLRPDCPDGWPICIESQVLPLWITAKRFHKEHRFNIVQLDL